MNATANTPVDTEQQDLAAVKIAPCSNEAMSPSFPTTAWTK
jgi:hypothetical protein